MSDPTQPDIQHPDAQSDGTSSSSNTQPQWFYARAGQQIGPISKSILTQLILARQIAANDLVWSNGMPQWSAAISIPEFAGLFATLAPPQAPPTLGYMGGQSEAPTYAGFWIRFVAAVIDAIVVGIPLLVLVAILYIAIYGANFNPAAPAPIDPWFNILPLPIWWLYQSLMESSGWQATLGKRAMGIVVTDLDGNRMTFGRASARHWAGQIFQLLALPLGFLPQDNIGVMSFTLLLALCTLIAYVMAAFHPKKQALHDILAGTLALRGQV